MPSVGAYIWCLTSQVSLAPTNCHLPGILVFSFPNKRSTIANANSSFKKVANANSSFFPLQGLWLRWRLKFAPADHEVREEGGGTVLAAEASKHPILPLGARHRALLTVAPQQSGDLHQLKLPWPAHRWCCGSTRRRVHTTWWARAQEMKRKVRGV